MKKRMMLLIAMLTICITEISADKIWYFCHRGQMKIYFQHFYTNPLTGLVESNTTFCCYGGGCPSNLNYIFSVNHNLLANANDWATTEIDEDSYDGLSSMTAAPSQPAQPFLDSLNHVMDSLSLLPNMERWADPLKIDQNLANDLDLYNQIEVYAPTIFSNPSTNKKVKFSFRCSSGNTVSVTLKNGAGTTIYSNTFGTVLGDNVIEFTATGAPTGTYQLRVLASKNEFNRAVIIQ